MNATILESALCCVVAFLALVSFALSDYLWARAAFYKAAKRLKESERFGLIQSITRRDSPEDRDALSAAGWDVKP